MWQPATKLLDLAQPSAELGHHLLLEGVPLRDQRGLDLGDARLLKVEEVGGSHIE